MATTKRWIVKNYKGKTVAKFRSREAARLFKSPAPQERIFDTVNSVYVR